jgi:tRNA (guanine37-N1)-methyltransferase
MKSQKMTSVKKGSKTPLVSFHVLSLFPESIQAYFDSSMLKRAQADGHIAVHQYQVRDYADNKWHRVDQRPYGGGPGMVLEAEPFLKAHADAVGKKKAKVIFFSPQGQQFTNDMAREFSKEKNIVFLCGHYEGIDARVIDILKAEPVSVGPYVLTSGELAAAIVLDAVARQVPGVLGNSESLEEDRTASPRVYTRPDVLVWKKKKYTVPEVLKEGNHKHIEQWKEKQREDFLE